MIKTLLIVGLVACSWQASCVPVEIGLSAVSSEPLSAETIDSNQVDSTSSGFPVSALSEIKSKSAGNIAFELGLSDIVSEPVRDDEPQASIVQSTADQSNSAKANSETIVEGVQEETDSVQAESVHENIDAPVEPVQETDVAQEGAEHEMDQAQEGVEHEMDQAQDDGHVARFTGMMPSEMFAWIQDESARDGDPDDPPATADEDELKREDDELRTAEFASAIIAAMDDSGAA
ncbi:hypothetical protein H4S00_003355 [Coemansia sp. D1744]|nr:hypothetical protein H4S00_003355 [Coemansia sp. D1744]